MKGNYTCISSACGGSSEEEHPKMKGNYTLGQLEPDFLDEEDHPKMKGKCFPAFRVSGPVTGKDRFRMGGVVEARRAKDRRDRLVVPEDVYEGEAESISATSCSSRP